MKITVVPYDAQWKNLFDRLKRDLQDTLSATPCRIDQIGSTSVEGLSAKPIIDILIGLDEEEALNTVVNPLLECGYIYYEVYNEAMPYRRFFIKTKDNADNSLTIRTDDEVNELNVLAHHNRIAHIHIIPKDSIHWLRHMAFKKYLLAHDNVKLEYQQLKEKLSQQDWKDGNDYNAAKNNFIKLHEALAITWYQASNKDQ